MIRFPRYLVMLALAGAVLGCSVTPAPAQTKVLTTCGTNVPGSYPIGSTGQALTLQADGTLCVNATVNASIAGFAPNGNYATLTAAGTSGSVALPSGAVVLFQNIGTTAVSCVLGVGSATATASKIVIQPASWFGVTVGSNTFGACIDQTGSTSNTVVLAGGTGLPTGAGGGSGGSGGGGAVTVADSADVTEGGVADAASTAGGTGTLSAKLRLMTTQLGTLNTTLGTPMQATGGTVAATQSGTWTMQPGNTANSTPWLVTSASATAPVVTMNSASANGGLNSALAGVFDDAAPTAITENSFGFLRMSTNRNLYGTIRDAAGNERGANVNASGQLAVAGPVTAVSGGYASGSIASGAMVDLGSQADAACGTATGTCSLIALQKFNNSATSGAIPAGTADIGNTGVSQASTTSGQKGPLVQGAVTTAAPTYTTAQTNPLSLTTAGALRNDTASIAGTATATGSGAMNAGTQRIAMATDSPGIVTLGQTTKSASVPVTIASDQYLDVCANPAIAKVSVPIGITSAATTALVATSASTVIYGCGFVFSISQVVTTANTLKFVTGTGATCGTGQSDLTGLFGGGGVTAAAPIVIKQGMGSTIFKTAAGGALCATTAIGASASFQGILTYVQQ